ncbi:MAG: hypothetical protein HY286_01380 [Planctomycetes bacterium]|nr:hypothetical protein [Planctomycetota bacterium]
MLQSKIFTFASLISIGIIQNAPSAAASRAGGASRLWNASALKDWATPLAGLKLAPSFVSESDYYAAPVDNLRTYPVYHPDREPRGYRESLIKLGALPLIEPDKLISKADWIAAGKRVFEALDTPGSRTNDPSVIAHFTDAKTVDKYRDVSHDVMSADGVLLDYRWVVDRDRSLKLSFSSCAGCHSRLMPDGSVLAGAPSNYDLSDSPAVNLMLKQIRVAPKLNKGGRFYAEFGVPWVAGDAHLKFKTMTDAELDNFNSQDDGAPPGTMFARFNGSPLFETRMADLRGVRDRKYLDATATHANRGPEDIARYGILVEYADEAVFGNYQMLPGDAMKVPVRPPDEAMVAMAMYIYSLDPAPSPHPFDENAKRGKEIFESKGCHKCHAPPIYTNNKLVAVDGFEPPADDAATAGLNISERRVHTDAGLALQTRKGTGYYKIPSLRGLWYRGLYGHSGFVTSLEDWFDRRRLQNDYVPSGWRGPGVKSRAVPGHEFGLDLSAEDKKALISFLMTL